MENKGTQYATTSTQTFTPSSGYDGISSIKIGAVSIPNTLTAANVKKGVEIKIGDSGNATRFANITGEYEPVASFTEPQSPSTTITASIDGISGSDITAHIVRNVNNIYVIDGTTYVQGTSKVYGKYDIPTTSGGTFNTNSSDQTIHKNAFILNDIVIKGVKVSNTLVAENVKKDVIITVGDENDPTRMVNVTGSYEGSGGSNGTITAIGCTDGEVPSGQERRTGAIRVAGTNITNAPYDASFTMNYESFTPSSSSISSAAVYFQLGDTKIGRFSDGNLTASNIKKGVSIMGISGSWDTDAAYNAGMAFQKSKVVLFVGTSATTTYNGRKHDSDNTNKTTITENGEFWCCGIGYPNKDGPYSSGTYDSNSYMSAYKFTVSVPGESHYSRGEWSLTKTSTNSTVTATLKKTWNKTISDPDGWPAWIKNISSGSNIIIYT